MIEAWQSSLEFCETQMISIRNREAYLKSIKIIQDQQDALQIIISSVDIEPPPTTEAEIDASLAIHEDQKAAIQIQHDILKSSGKSDGMSNRIRRAQSKIARRF